MVLTLSEIRVKDVGGNGVPVSFGPVSCPGKFRIDLLAEARERLSSGTFDFNEFQLVIGDRLGENSYPVTDRATMPPNYLCEGSVWLALFRPDGRDAVMGLVPHLHKSDSHHNFWLYWQDFDGSKGACKRVPGHQIPVDEPVVVSISCGEETRNGTVIVKR
jgi:hypothetical protein